MPERQPPVQPASQRAPLFQESGASWYWLLTGPAAGAAMLWIQQSSGYGPQPLMPVALLVLVSGFIAIQVKAARVHTSVELTAETLRQGTETIRVADILNVYPEPAQPAGRRAAEPEKWQSARALGELSGVPRGRAGIGLRLAGRRTAQAWARHHRALRAALTPLVQERMGSTAGPAASGPDLDDLDDRDDGGTAESQW